MLSRQSPNKIRFLLTEIENGFNRELNYLDSKLEHVCLYHPNQAWCRSFGEGVDEIADHLGNMVLLERDELGCADFVTKKQAYRQSPFKLANKVAEAESWDLTTLNHYQCWLAEQAVKVWRLEW